MPAGEGGYEDVAYGDLVFEDIDWSEVGDHDPACRSQRKDNAEKDVYTEWATEACQDDERLVRPAGSRTGLTIKVTGLSPSAGFVVTVVLAPKDHPPQGRWWGATAWAANGSEIKQDEEGR